MNSTLLLANAIALAVLASFHFSLEDGPPQTLAQRMPHYLQVQRTPQLAVLSDQNGFKPEVASSSEQALPTTASERLVF